MDGRLKVMLTTEGTYPYHQGGVSTWCNILVKNLPQVEYTIYSVIMHPFVTLKFDLPPKTGLIKVPLWGTEEPSEHLDKPFSSVYIGKRQTGYKAVRDHFIPLFMIMVEEILSQEKDNKRLGLVLSEMNRYFEYYDYRKSFKSEITWDIYKKMVYAYISDPRNNIDTPNVYAMIQSLGWLYRFFTILNTPIPKVDVTHSAAAAFCTIPGVLAKVQSKTPLLLTEHGVYLREQYLSLSKRGYPSFLNTFLMKMLHSVAGLSYHFADQVSPVCNYNTRWEKELGVKPDHIRVIYNGVDKNVFSPSRETLVNKYPTVVSVARIDPVKDLFNLIRAAAVVKTRIPETRFIVYGSVTVPEYFEQCKLLVKELDLEETFIFAGHIDDVPAAYKKGDVIALSSITEAFPYSVVEAMMTGKAVVATDVGGIKEALGQSGLVVRPRDPMELAKSIIYLLENPRLRVTLGEEARQRALNYFTIENVLNNYLESYRTLAGVRADQSLPAARVRRQKLYVEKGYAFLTLGYSEEAIQQFRLAVNEAPDTKAVPVILMEMASAYNKMGKYEHAFSEMEKAELLMQLHQNAKSA